MTNSLFITCAEYLEPLLLKELSELGITNTSLSRRGVSIPFSMENIFKVNYLSRLATRALAPLLQFSCPTKEVLYRQTSTINWSPFLTSSMTFAIDANVSHPEIRHSLYAAQIVKDAICDQIRNKTGERPSIDVKNPDVQLNLLIHNKKALLSFDTSGSPLYKRGWKEASTEATLPETLAAAMLILSNYSAKDLLCDPFCGTGTLLIEAACIATNTPAGFFREKWGFFHHPLFSMESWLAFKNHYDAKRLLGKSHCILGADQDPKAIQLCEKYVKELGFEREIQLLNTPISSLAPPRSPTLVVTDPPFGKRMDASKKLYEQLGQFLRDRCQATPFAFVLGPSFSLVRGTGCEVLSEKPLEHGGLKTHLFQLKV